MRTPAAGCRGSGISVQHATKIDFPFPFKTRRIESFDLFAIHLRDPSAPFYILHSYMDHREQETGNKWTQAHSVWRYGIQGLGAGMVRFGREAFVD